eukprot:scaffold67491_cov66-Phaeocystis_antarctica.AAC.1
MCIRDSPHPRLRPNHRRIFRRRLARRRRRVCGERALQRACGVRPAPPDGWQRPERAAARIARCALRAGQAGQRARAR